MSDSIATYLARLAPLALKRAPGLPEGQDIPRIAVNATVPVEADWLARYRALIGAVDDGVLPPCTPQVLAVGLHLRILGDRRFPLPVLGTVHVLNRIEERAPIPARSTLALSCVLEGQKRDERGITIEISTEARAQGSDTVVWRSVLTALIRNRSKRAAKTEKGERPAEPAQRWASSSTVRLPEDLGRRYARIAGDANPIHLSALTAKPFGFPRAIIHGMWTLGRALVEADAVFPLRPRTITARFIRPVFLPGTIVVSASVPDAHGIVGLRVAPLRPGAPHMLADVAPAH